jgi:hypothetical protein
VIGPPWFADALAALLLVVAAYDLGRLAVATGGSGRWTERDVDAYHVAMGVSMAGMLTGGLTGFERQAWAVVFAFTTVWFALRLPWTEAVRAVERQSVGHRLAHVVSSGAMVYMMLAVPGGSMAAMASGVAGPGIRLPALAGLLAAVLLVAAAVQAERCLHPLRHADPATVRAPDAAVMASVGAATAPSTGNVPDGLASSDRFLAPRLAAATEVVMGLAMVAMLAAMARS